MNTKKWFNDKIKGFRGTIDYETEKVILTLTEKIVEFMENNNISRVEMAKRLGVSKAFVTKDFERLDSNPHHKEHGLHCRISSWLPELDIDICPGGVKVWKVYTPPTVREIRRHRIHGRIQAEIRRVILMQFPPPPPPPPPKKRLNIDDYFAEELRVKANGVLQRGDLPPE
ncbi:MAG: hypothetical protein MZV70_61655 [Desulfobacterales bacterium]|nr:hypothetical protein [Desulfobacterales bacterium]